MQPTVSAATLASTSMVVTNPSATGTGAADTTVAAAAKAVDDTLLHGALYLCWP